MKTMETTNGRYWIIVASKDHVQEGIKGGFAQACHGKTSPLQRMYPGDYIIYYSSKLYFHLKDKCQSFTAIGKVLTDPIYTVKMSEDFCPSRRNVQFFECKNAPILPLIDKLDFITNKSKWGFPFRFGILEISKSDFEIIAQKMIINGEKE